MEDKVLINFLSSKSLFLRAVGTCEAHKRVGDYATANKYFAVALLSFEEEPLAEIFVEGQPDDYYALLHLGATINGEFGSVCCPIPMLSEGYKNLAQLCGVIVDRQHHCRVFNDSPVNNLLNLSEDYLQKCYSSVFNLQTETEEFGSINSPELVDGEIVNGNIFDPWEEHEVRN